MERLDSPWNLSYSDSPQYESDGYDYDYYLYSDNYTYDNPQRMVPEVHVAAKFFLCFVYSLMMLVCGIGNLLLVYVIARHADMRTSFFSMICNLAVSDFLVAVLCAPFNLHYYLTQSWPYGETMCALIGYIKIVSIYVSTNSLLAIALDRYIVIVGQREPRMRRLFAITAMAATWIVSIVVSIPTAIYSKVLIFYEDGQQHAYCAEFWPQDQRFYLMTYDTFLLIAEFIIPLTVMIVCYVLIGRRIWLHKTPGKSSRGERTMAKKKQKIIRMLIVVVIFFAFCWIPYYSLMVFRDYFDNIYHSFIHSTTLYFVVEALAMSNSVINTILYIAMNKNVRGHLRNDLKGLLSKCAKGDQQNGISSDNFRTNRTTLRTSKL